MAREVMRRERRRVFMILKEWGMLTRSNGETRMSNDKSITKLEGTKA
jgi:hypothetical protein